MRSRARAACAACSAAAEPVPPHLRGLSACSPVLARLSRSCYGRLRPTQRSRERDQVISSSSGSNAAPRALTGSSQRQEVATLLSKRLCGDQAPGRSARRPPPAAACAHRCYRRVAAPSRRPLGAPAAPPPPAAAGSGHAEAAAGDTGRGAAGGAVPHQQGAGAAAACANMQLHACSWRCAAAAPPLL